MITYKPGAGEDIGNAAKEMVKMAHEKNEDVVATFNDIPLRATSVSQPQDLVQSFHEQFEERREAYKKTPEYAKAQDSALKRQQRLQETVDVGMRRLPQMDLNDHCEVLDWLVFIQDGTDHIRVKVPVEEIVKAFEDHGYQAGMNCDDDFIEGDEANHAGWIIGQALSNLQQVGAIHQMLPSFVEAWKEKFGYAEG